MVTGVTAMDGHDSLTAARAPGPQVRAWLLDMLPVAPGWKTAGELEAARVEAGIGKRALRTARERLLADGAIEKGRDGFQGRFRYRRAERAAVAESEAAPGHEAEPAASPEAGGGPAVPEVPERFAATLRFLAGAPVPEDFDRMAFIQSWMWQLRNAVERDGPRLMAAPNDDSGVPGGTSPRTVAFCHAGGRSLCHAAGAPPAYRPGRPGRATASRSGVRQGTRHHEALRPAQGRVQARRRPAVPPRAPRAGHRQARPLRAAQGRSRRLIVSE